MMWWTMRTIHMHNNTARMHRKLSMTNLINFRKYFNRRKKIHWSKYNPTNSKRIHWNISITEHPSTVVIVTIRLDNRNDPTMTGTKTYWKWYDEINFHMTLYFHTNGRNDRMNHWRRYNNTNSIINHWNTFQFVQPYTPIMDGAKRKEVILWDEYNINFIDNDGISLT